MSIEHPESWEQVANDPDPVADLGYAQLELEIIPTTTDRDRSIVLPKDESLLKEDAFLVMDASDIADLDQWA
jgi:hypothetical protein